MLPVPEISRCAGRVILPACIVTGKHAGDFPDMVFFAQSLDLGDRAAIFSFL